MKRKINYSLITGLKIIAILIIFSSCIPQKKIKYMQPTHEDSTNRTAFATPAYQKYHLGIGDNLYIKVRSLDAKSNDFFNNMGSNSNSNSGYNDASIYLNSYNVDQEGNIIFPFVGPINVIGLTLNQTQEKIAGILNEYLKETTIIVKLVNFNITFVGEIKKPGEYKIYQDNISIFEAVALAGDITDYGNRNEVKLMRKTDDGTALHILDLTREDILESPYFYLKPNDVIYIEPLKGKQFAFSTFPYALLFSTITTLIVLLTFIQVK
ncbi:polysaccharide biosynthesis/export family protein [Lentimicrobium sp. S6]|uniref:polysaccharide biosynthesis/export family protein n=1 Tax=Lentimicrobium sp. S6 TaxID=2735872 RepID=UPI0015552826|nr:polysaccharide biosynthesis/export family protein [Lentimicrobium sp. S6]NPD44183.1 polysaccharide export protein [Lentimicrobium sp. S6]